MGWFSERLSHLTFRIVELPFIHDINRAEAKYTYNTVYVLLSNEQ